MRKEYYLKIEPDDKEAKLDYSENGNRLHISRENPIVESMFRLAQKHLVEGHLKSVEVKVNTW